MSNESWFADGFSGVNESLKEQEARWSNKIRRVWVKAGASVDLLFLDDKAFTYGEHTLYIGGDYVSFTCVGAKNGCPKCLEELAPNAKKTLYRATAFSVIDTSQWVDKRGATHANEKKLYVVREKVSVIMQQCFQRFGGFKGKLITVTRTSKDDFSTGSGFSLAMQNGQLMTFDMNQLKPEDREPYNYMEILKPLPFEQVAALMRAAAKTEQNAQPVTKNTQQGAGGQQNGQPFDAANMSQVPF